MFEKPPARLLAKSYKRTSDKDPPAYALLERHTRDVAEAGGTLLNAVGQIAFDCAALEAASFEEFGLALKANCYVQDFGKANSHFHEMLFNPGLIQLIRHETLSGLLLTREPLRKWFAELRVRETLQLAALWGAIGHHRKFHRDTRPELGIPDADVFVTHRDFKLMLRAMKTELGFESDPPCFDHDLVVTEKEEGPYHIAADDALWDLCEKFEDRVKLFTAPEDRRMLALIKGFGIASDVAASSIGKREGQQGDYSVATAINKLMEACLSSDDLQQLIINRAWQSVEAEPPTISPKELPPEFDFNDLQKKAEQNAPRSITLVQAGCGSGKSLFAYKWAKAWSLRFEAEERKPFRLFFLLPTTGTATEQYKDYALEAGIEDTSLTHSRAPIDLEQIAETSELEEASENAGHDTSKTAREALKAKKDKAEALELWSTRLIVGTTDTVLGLMANALRSVCALPAIVSSAIVFDEIHAYDEQMFGHLLVFLKNFPRLPVLLMTASLPEVRLRAIKRVRTDLTEKDIIKDAGNFETWPRYRTNIRANDDEVWAKIESTIAQDGKVLWVRNQVKWANETYRECRERFAAKYDVKIDIYHSRLCYIHRSKRHRRVIDNFKAEIKKGGIKERTKGAILIATQVAEMSLDLSADLLVTDIAPVTALIQRLGRLNRRPKPKNVEWAYVRSLPKNKSNPKRPYEDENNFEEKARDWLHLLAQPERDLNQKDLACAFAQVEGEAQGDFDIGRAEEAAYFFSGLWQTKPGTTRGAGYTISVILKQHLEQCDKWDRRGEPAREWVRKWEVPITFHDEILGWERKSGVFVAPDEAVGYDYRETTDEHGMTIGEGTGAYWKR